MIVLVAKVLKNLLMLLALVFRLTCITSYETFHSKAYLMLLIERTRSVDQTSDISPMFHETFSP